MKTWEPPTNQVLAVLINELTASELLTSLLRQKPSGMSFSIKKLSLILERLVKNKDIKATHIDGEVFYSYNDH